MAQERKNRESQAFLLFGTWTTWAFSGQDIGGKRCINVKANRNLPFSTLICPSMVCVLIHPINTASTDAPSEKLGEDKESIVNVLPPGCKATVVLMSQDQIQLA